MKKIGKLTAIPYGVCFRYPKSPLRLLVKLSEKQQLKYKKRNRIFSLELGRSLSKRVFWQLSVQKNRSLLGKRKLSYSMPVFKRLFFGKMWLLNNASIAPGVIWPTKSKRKLVAKIRAFKALNLSLGGFQKKFLLKSLQKIYSNSFTASTCSAVWRMASSLDCLKASFFMKLGFFLTFPNARSVLRKTMLSEELNSGGNPKTFLYPGDFHCFLKKGDFFAESFSMVQCGSPRMSKPVKNMPFV